PNMRPSRGLFGLLTITLIIVVVVIAVTSMGQQSRRVTWREFTSLIKTNQIETNSIEIKDTGIFAIQSANTDTGHGKTRIVFPLTGGERDFYRQQLMELTGGEFQEKSSPIWTQILISILPFIIVLGLIWLFIDRGLRNAAGGAGGVL